MDSTQCPLYIVDDPNIKCTVCNAVGHRKNSVKCPQYHGCSNCHARGHMTRDCPSMLDRGIICSVCNEVGHQKNSTKCPQYDGCSKCHARGHITRNCPNTDSERNSAKCSACHEAGHQKNSIRCPLYDGCSNCHDRGHLTRDCPSCPHSHSTSARSTSNRSTSTDPSTTDRLRISARPTSLQFFEGSSGEEDEDEEYDLEGNLFIRIKIINVYNMI